MAYTSRQAVIDLDSELAFDVTDQLKYPALQGQLADVHHAHLRFPIQYEDGSLKRFEVNHFITLPQSNVTSAPDRPFGWHELCPIHSALQKLCLRTGAEYRLLFPPKKLLAYTSQGSPSVLKTWGSAIGWHGTSATTTSTSFPTDRSTCRRRINGWAPRSSLRPVMQLHSHPHLISHRNGRSFATQLAQSSEMISHTSSRTTKSNPKLNSSRRRPLLSNEEPYKMKT